MKNILPLERVAVLHKAVQAHAQAIQRAAGQGLADRLQAEDKKGFVMPVNIFDITDTERWAYDGFTIVNPDDVDKESEEYKRGEIYNPYRGAKPIPRVEVLDVVL